LALWSFKIKALNLNIELVLTINQNKGLKVYKNLVVKLSLR
jgi:hypothetical protein